MKSSFKEEKEKESSVGSISNSYNTSTHNTTIGDNSPIASDNSKAEQTINPEPKPAKAKTWKDYLKEEIVKHGIRYFFTALTFFTIGLISGKGCNRQLLQERNKQSSSQNSNIVSSNKDTASLDNIQ